MYFELEFGDKNYYVTKTEHSSKKKEGYKKARDAGINKQGFQTLITEAMKNGLNSYKNSKVVLTFNDSEPRRISVLIEHFGEKIEIISVFRNWKNDDFKNNYITVQNRINLTQVWSLPRSGQPGNFVWDKPIKYIRSKSVKTKNGIRKIEKKEL